MSWKDDIDSVKNMAEKWDISPHYLKYLCSTGKVDCKKVGRTWVVYTKQPKPVIKEYNWKS